uniref:Uncharacterized protein n=1 Tax=Arundo donax TaxID=35708 RepID=A0A0A9D4F3_ARUDO
MQRPKIPFLYLHRTCLIAIGSNCTTAIPPLWPPLLHTELPHLRRKFPLFQLISGHPELGGAPQDLLHQPLDRIRTLLVGIARAYAFFPRCGPWNQARFVAKLAISGEP